jgi:hypothetical protein
LYGGVSLRVVVAAAPPVDALTGSLLDRLTYILEGAARLDAGATGEGRGSDKGSSEPDARHRPPPFFGTRRIVQIGHRALGSLDVTSSCIGQT